MTRETFEASIARLHGQLLRIARKRLPQNDAEDAVQNTVLAAWKHLEQLRDDSAFDPWIRQILMNECNQILRAQKRRTQIDTILKEQAALQKQKNDLPVYEALGELDIEDRELLELHHEQGYSIAELSRTLGKSEDVVKMRLYRARKRLRIILISLLILLLGMAVAVGTGLMDVQWFFSHRRAVPTQINTDYKSDVSASYSGRYLAAEAIDSIWDLDTLTLHFTYSLTGIDEDAIIVNNVNIGVDGVRMDYIWIDDQILPVAQWANGRTVYTYFLDGWRMNDAILLNGSEDTLPDGKGDAFLASFQFDRISAEAYASSLSCEGMLSLASDVYMHDYETGELIEKAVLTIELVAPSTDEWRAAYEEYYR